MVTIKSPDELIENKLMNQAKREVVGFEELKYRFERTVSVLGRSWIIRLPLCHPFR
jgi:hypothetical protein